MSLRNQRGQRLTLESIGRTFKGKFCLPQISKMMIISLEMEKENVVNYSVKQSATNYLLNEEDCVPNVPTSDNYDIEEVSTFLTIIYILS